jgi:hypothetical protein
MTYVTFADLAVLNANYCKSSALWPKNEPKTGAKTVYPKKCSFAPYFIAIFGHFICIFA